MQVYVCHSLIWRLTFISAPTSPTSVFPLANDPDVAIGARGVPLPSIFVKMYLAEADARLFFAVVPAFVDALPPSPGQHQSEDRNQANRDNAITFLRFEIQELPRVFTKDRATYDLSEDAFSTASDALEDILVLLDERVDDAMLGHECGVSVGQPLLIDSNCLAFYAGRALPKCCDTTSSPVLPSEAL